MRQATGEASATEIAPRAEIRVKEIVDLDQWIVAVDKVNPEIQNDAPEPESATGEEPPFALIQEAGVSWTHFRQSEQTQLAFTFS